LVEPSIYVEARRVLLDGLGALEPHLAAVTLVGAQAIYLRVGEADLAVAPTTTDGDLALDPAALKDSPALERLMGEGGFERKRGTDGKPLVGLWVRREDVARGARVSVDLLVPEEAASPAGRRAARLDGHETGSVLKVPGLEACLVDADVMRVASLELEDERAFDIRVAGPAALVIAKVHKIGDRALQAHRAEDKDALDVWRLLRGTPPEEFRRRLDVLRGDDRSAACTQRGLALFQRLFGERDGTGVLMAIRATERLAAPEEVSASLTAIAASAVFRAG